MAIMQIQNLKFTYPGTSRPALHDVSLSVEDSSFVVVCGTIGSGKSTLLRHMKPELTPHGTRTGRVLFKGKDVNSLATAESAARVGYVLQDPDSQIVTDTVWHELAFGLENLAMDPDVIRRRVAEMASFFGIAPWFRQSCSTLSSGQKQILTLASIMAMQPEVLVLDEPTAQLDPIAAGEFLQLLERIHRELGITVILAEQRLEDTLPLADHVIVMHDGALVCDSPPAETAAALAEGMASTMPETYMRMVSGLPAAMRVALAAHGKGEWSDADRMLPVTPREGRVWMHAHLPDEMRSSRVSDPALGNGNVSLEAREIWFRYRRRTQEVLRGLSLAIREKEIHAILGGNGSGKSTLLSLLSGLDRPQSGKIVRKADKRGMDKSESVARKLVLLGSDSRAIFLHETVAESFAHGIPDPDRFGVRSLMDRHPMDLSTGERQKAALALALSSSPGILLLDEPTRGLDPETRETLYEVLRERADAGCAVLFVTHDVEFAASSADRCSLLFDGEIVSSGPPRSFFAGNRFYTTAANRMAREWDPEIVTVGDILDRWGLVE